MTQAQSLPARPNLAYLKKLAKERLRSLRSAKPAANLAEAQLAVARDHGFASWRTGLHDCIEVGRDEIQELLLDAGADVDVCVAAVLGRYDRLRELLERDPALANDLSTNVSPLGWAAYGLKTESARILLDRGA